VARGPAGGVGGADESGEGVSLSDDSFGEALKRIRRRRRWFVGLFLGWIPFGGVLAVVAQAFGGLSEATLLVPALAYMLTWAVFSGLVTYSHCPRCGKLFHGPYWWSNPVRRRCKYCRLPIKEPRHGD